MAIVTHMDTTGYANPLTRWCAYEAEGFDLGSPIGKGPTEDAAISDLEQQLDDADEAAEAAKDAACEWCAGTGWITGRSRTSDYNGGARCFECKSFYRQERGA